MLFECRVMLSAARLDNRGDVFEYRAYGNELPGRVLNGCLRLFFSSYSLRFKIKVTFGHKLCYEIKVTSQTLPNELECC